MNIHQHPACNDVLLPPKGDPTCRPLPIMRSVDADGLHLVASYWKPTPEELATLQASGVVQLVAWGRTHPPIYITTVEAS